MVWLKLNLHHLEVKMLSDTQNRKQTHALGIKSKIRSGEDTMRIIDKLDDLLEELIGKFVLCEQCGNPETRYEPTDNQKGR